MILIFGLFLVFSIFKTRNKTNIMKGLTKEERDRKLLTSERKKCSDCNKNLPLKKYSWSTGGKNKLYYMDGRCNKCQYKKRKKLYKDRINDYVKKQRKKENTIEGRAIRLLYNCKNRARQSSRDIEFSLTRENIIKLCKPMKCSITNVGLTLEYGFPETISVDRIDNNKGYTDDNIQIVAQMYNFCKNNFTDKETINFLKKIDI